MSTRRTLQPKRRGLRFKPGVTRGLRSATGRPASYDAQKRTFEFVLASENPVRTWRMDARSFDLVEVDEVLPMSGLEGLDELIGAPILNSHSSWSVGDVIGVIEHAEIDGTELVCRGRLSERRDVGEIGRDIETGVLRSMSVGFQVLEDGRAKDRSGAVPLITVKRWKPIEASVVAMPADDTAKIRSRSGRSTNRNSRSKRMDTLTQAAEDNIFDAVVEIVEDLLADTGVDLDAETIDAIADDVCTAVADIVEEDADGGEGEGEGERKRGRRGRRSSGRRSSKRGRRSAGKSGKADDATVKGLRAACHARGLADAFDAMHAAGADISELRGVLASGLRTSNTEVDGRQRPGAGARSTKDVRFENTSAGRRAAARK